MIDKSGQVSTFCSVHDIVQIYPEQVGGPDTLEGPGEKQDGVTPTEGKYWEIERGAVRRSVISINIS